MKSEKTRAGSKFAKIKEHLSQRRSKFHKFNENAEKYFQLGFPFVYKQNARAPTYREY